MRGMSPRPGCPLYEAAVAMVNGLGYDRALKAITLDAARILKVDADYGSLEPGKVADLVLFDGDPFEYASHVSHVLLGGKLVYDREPRPSGRSAAWAPTSSSSRPAACPIDRSW